MAKTKVVDIKGKKKEDINLKDEIFNIEPDDKLIALAIKQYLASRRQGSANAKTRAEVRGGGAKPWRQKGTGRARAGSTRSSIWVGGGTTFGPRPRDFSFRVPKKQKVKALLSALSKKFRENKLIIVDRLDFDEPKTKMFSEFLYNVCDDGFYTTTVYMGKDEDKYQNAKLSARNIEFVKFSPIESINVYNIVTSEKLILTKACVDRLQEVYS